MRAALPLLCPALLCAQAPSATTPLAWLEGTWIGSAQGVYQEETWSGLVQGHIHGMYREMRDGKLLTMEWLMIAPEREDTWLTMRHFDAAMQPVAREKDVPLRWKLVLLKPNHARFELSTGGSLEYWREGNLLRAELNLPGPHGQNHHETFAFTRKP